MIRGTCIYARVMVEMYLSGMDNRTLAKKAGIHYASLRRKLRGDTPIKLDEAARIRRALASQLPLDQLFEKMEGGHVAG